MDEIEESYSSSEDEEERFRNFDNEADKIVQVDTLPLKSSNRYMLVYSTYQNWLKNNRKSLSKCPEKNLIVYFTELKEKLQPPTLWCIWSMLRKTLNTHDNLNISNFLNLKSLIKNNCKGYRPKKAFALRWHQVDQFMRTAPDYNMLDTKVILIFGICGCLRCDELTNLKVEDVEDLQNEKLLVTIQNNKNDYPGYFIIGKLFYNTVKKYIALRPDGNFSDRFFIQYREGKCVRQPIGRHNIGKKPFKIASFLNLPNASRYTGHCFRRTSATLLSESRANMQMIKQLGRWRSDIIAQGYIEDSLHNKEMLYEGVVSQFNHQSNSIPSSTKSNFNHKKNAKQQSAPVIQPPASSKQNFIVENQVTNCIDTPSTSADPHSRYQYYSNDACILQTNTNTVPSSNLNEKITASVQNLNDEMDMNDLDFSEEFSLEDSITNHKKFAESDQLQADNDSNAVDSPGKFYLRSPVKLCFKRPNIEVLKRNDQTKLDYQKTNNFSASTPEPLTKKKDLGESKTEHINVISKATSSTNKDGQTNQNIIHQKQNLNLQTDIERTIQFNNCSCSNLTFNIHSKPENIYD